jgi:HPt (histidine-containing phosphotransfer) domain-containing protein
MISHLSGDMDALFQDVHKLKGAAAVCQYEKIAIMSENYCEAIRDKQFDEIDYYQAQLVLACSEAEA